ncbi:superinfection exclusion protein B [Chitinophaga dinghuensis]|uniref:Superinfection exclusion protein B n=1 Tax=Chitinophaga dinghuensis TaxID=1539050 RepID=A0A327VMV3_9BACT|nr:superinfection exclusion B family protein [Chitinophaga dinghuensis]RAJ76685.1 superinfection exclusion protein B [Chitinophaga dinghuensis]
MDKILEKLFDIQKVPTKIIFVICLCSAVLLFVPSNFLTKLNLSVFLSDYGKYIGITFIITLSLLVISTLNSFFKYIKNLISKRRFKKEILVELVNLNSNEKALIREFFIQDKFAIQIPIYDDTMIGLLNKGIIYQASNIGPVDLRGAVFNYSLNALVRRNLSNHLLELPSEPTDAQRNAIIAARPQWAMDQESMNRRWRNNTWS